MSAVYLTPTVINEFAAAVRQALAGLSPDEIDELTDGLEADLAESASDSGSIDLGDPVAYAEELRTAAGLTIPPVSKQAVHPLAETLALAARLKSRVVTGLRGNPLSASILETAVVLRPVWWIARGWVIYQLVLLAFFPSQVRLIPQTPLHLIILLAFIALSVQWGRGRWLPYQWLALVRIVASVVAVIALPWTIAAAVANSTVYYDSATDNYSPPPGLSENGNPVSNIFAYDAEGNPLTNVQLFDQDGNPLSGQSSDTYYNTQYDDADGTETVLVPSGSVPGRLGWNVYPLRVAPGGTLEQITNPSAVVTSPLVTSAPLPFASVQPLVPATPDASSALPGTTPTPEPTTPGTTSPSSPGTTPQVTPSSTPPAATPPAAVPTPTGTPKLTPAPTSSTKP